MSGIPSESAKAQAQAQQPDSNKPSFESIGVKNTTINTAPGVNLSPHQKLLVGSVLDLFTGNPTLAHLSLWSPTATFADPLSIATGFDRFAAQWYGLAALFKPIRLVSHRVVSDKNPLEIEMRNKYTVKLVGSEHEIASRVCVFVDAKGNKIEKVEDRWEGKLPEGAVSEAFRKLNAVTVPVVVKVPKTEEEDRKMQAEREKS